MFSLSSFLPVKSDSSPSFHQVTELLSWIDSKHYEAARLERFFLTLYRVKEGLGCRFLLLLIFSSSIHLSHPAYLVQPEESIGEGKAYEGREYDS